MSLMNKLKTQAPAAPSADTNFPVGPPIMVPRFLSEGKRKTRRVNKFLKTPRAGVPILPLAVAPGTIPEEAVNFDPKEPSSVQAMAALIRQVIGELNIQDVQVGGKTARVPSKGAQAIKEQQAKMTAEEDGLYKVGSQHLLLEYRADAYLARSSGNLALNLRNHMCGRFSGLRTCFRRPRRSVPYWRSWTQARRIYPRLRCRIREVGVESKDNTRHCGLFPRRSRSKREWLGPPARFPRLRRSAACGSAQAVPASLGPLAAPFHANGAQT